MLLPLLASTWLLTATSSPGAAAILQANQAASHGAAFAADKTLQLEYAVTGQGLTGKGGTTYDLRTGNFIDTFDVGSTNGSNGFDGKQAWNEDATGSVTIEQGGDARQIAVVEAYQDANAWWRPDRGGATISSLGVKSEAGRSFDVLAFTVAGKALQGWFDRTTHLLTRTIELEGSQTVTIDLSNYAMEGGLLLAHKMVVDQGVGKKYLQTFTLTGAHLLPPRPPSAFAAPHQAAFDAHIANPTGRATVPFKLLNNHIYAEGSVNGKSPVIFIFDTGGQDLLTPGTAEKLGIKSEGQAPTGGAGEDVAVTSFAKGVNVQLGDLVLQNQAFTVVQFISAAAEGLDEQGMIGFQVFQHFVTQIDYGQKTLTFIDPAKFDPKDAGTAIPFIFYGDNPEVKGSFDGIPGAFTIDTGSRVELTLTKPFVDSHHLKDKYPHGVEVVDGWGVGGPVHSYVARAPQLTLGTVRTEGVVTGFSLQGKGAFADGSYEGNVGSGLLKRFVVTLDYGHQLLYLKPLPTPVVDAGAFDRSGCWMNASPNGFVVVALSAKGAASSAGLKMGDEITEVEGTRAKSLVLSELRQKLRDEPPGTAVALKVKRGGHEMPVTLTLKDQI